jgi:hypothetical protein
LNFLVTGRYSRGAMKFPSPLEYSPDWNFQVKLNYDITQNTKLQINGMYTGADNAGSKMTNYLTSQTGGRQGEDFGSAYVPSYFISAYDDYKYWPYGAGNLNTPVPPEFIDMYSFQAKLTHVFNPSTYLDVMVYHNDFKLKSEWDFMSDNPNYRTYKAGGRFKPLNNPFYWGNDNGDVFKNNADTRNTTIKADFVSQINPIHQVKAGFTFSPQYISWTLHESNAISHLLYNDYYPNEFSPWEAGAYVQDKVEFRGLIMNLGLRFDMYNVNRKVSANPFDQYQWGIIGPGTVPNEIGIPHFDEDGPNAVKSPTQIALSPRIGISHPISETTVLHFMYGHFNMRPPWLMMGSQPGGALRKPLREEQLPTHGAFDPLAGDINNYHQYPNNTGNVQLDFEKIVQYEIGFKQNIQDKLGIDVTMYYKEGKDLATIGLKNDHSIASGFGTTTRRATRMAGQPEGNLNKVGKGRVGVIQMTTNVGYQDVRGVEVTLDTEFWRYVNFQVVYNYSQSTTGRHGFFQIYRDNSRAELLAAGYSEDQVDALRKLSEDDWYDVSLYDRGRTGNNNAYWNPANSVKLYANLNTPLEFGPKLGTFYPLGDWYLNIYSQWAQGRRYTWHAPDDPSDEPLNMRWKDHYKTNLRLAKGIRLMNNIRTELFMNIVNAFNDKTLRLPGNRDQYHLEGKLPFHPQTKEDLEWTWYEFSTLPREIYFGLRFEF